MLAKLFGRKKSPTDSLDTVLLHWGPTDPFTARSLLNGGVLVNGKTGSAKTTAVGALLGQSIMDWPRSAMQIHTAKPEDAAMWLDIHRRSGRREQLHTFGIDHPVRFNLTKYMNEQGADTAEFVNCFMTLGEVVKGRDGSSGGEDAAYWEMLQRGYTYDGVTIMKLATGGTSVPDLQEFLGGTARSPSELDDPHWQKGFHCECMMKAHAAPKSEIEKYDFDAAKRKFLVEMPGMADRTRSSIESGVMGMLHTFNTGPVRKLFSTTTNWTPESMLREGNSLLIDAPVSKYGESGKLINGILKWVTQWTVLRRQFQSQDYVSVIFADEGHNIFNSMDSRYIAESRSHGGCMIFMTQGIDSFFSALGGKGAEPKVNSFLSQFGHNVVHALSDYRTAEHFSKLVGRKMQITISGSSPPPSDMFGELMGTSKVSASFHQHMENILEPRAFMTGLRTGGPPHFVADAILIRAGEPFSNGSNWMKLTLKQRLL